MGVADTVFANLDNTTIIAPGSFLGSQLICLKIIVIPSIDQNLIEKIIGSNSIS
jgi:hypothetical protein